MTKWGGQRGQPVARIKAAIAGCAASVPTFCRSKRISNGTICSRETVCSTVTECFGVRSRRAGKDKFEEDIEWAKFMPWERQAALRVLNLMTAASLERLQKFRRQLAEGEAIDARPEMWRDPNVENRSYFLSKYERAYGVELATAEKKAEWLETTHPTDLRQIGFIGMSGPRAWCRYEAWRRSTMMVLALEAYWLEHGKLPDKLDQLKPAYFDKLPLDPYAGRPFYYFPNGISADKLSNVARDDRSYVAQVFPGMPGIWSLGPDLDMEIRTDGGVDVLTPEFRNIEDFRWNSATVWQRGLWFPIPEQKR